MSLMKQDMPELLFPHSSPFFPSCFFSQKLIHLNLIKSLMKPDTFNAS